jgi:hypothetical protein
VELLDPAHDQGIFRTRAAEQGEVVTGPGDHVVTADQLAGPGAADACCEGARLERDDLPFRRVEETAGDVDAKGASPDARG